MRHLTTALQIANAVFKFASMGVAEAALVAYGFGVICGIAIGGCAALFVIAMVA